MDFRTVLNEASKLATPEKSESAAIKLATKIVLNKLNLALQRKKISAKAIVGGSLGKGTWLPGAADIDCFVRFRYWKYKKQTNELADILEPAIEHAFAHYDRLHGSRDYYQVKYDDYTFEFVPVLKIWRTKNALNITDISPLHVDWIRKKTRGSKLKTQIRLAKLFFKASGVYGAESYIKGFSGHVTEILTINYGSFLKLAKATQSWKPLVYVDPESHYSNKEKAIAAINEAKLNNPLLVIDPTQPERNAAAALGLEKFNRLIRAFKSLLENPMVSKFIPKRITVEQLKSRAEGYKLILLIGTPQHDKKDIAGAKLLKQFEHISQELKSNDFEISKKGWQWEDTNHKALFWFYMQPKTLSETKRHWGPPMTSEKARLDGFTKKYKKKVKNENGKLYVILERKYRKPEELIRSIIKTTDFKNIKFLRDNGI